jgi:hypothetical protein
MIDGNDDVSRLGPGFGSIPLEARVIKINSRDRGKFETIDSKQLQLSVLALVDRLQALIGM